ncbi:MAG: hypothetical protein M3Q81_04640, partial [bacterium]|nr:hypothetical protein [bacterium]
MRPERYYSPAQWAELLKSDTESLARAREAQQLIRKLSVPHTDFETIANRDEQSIVEILPGVIVTSKKVTAEPGTEAFNTAQRFSQSREMGIVLHHHNHGFYEGQNLFVVNNTAGVLFSLSSFFKTRDIECTWLIPNELLHNNA